MEKRVDFLMLLEVVDANLNGDPDAGNQPRTDAETGQGIVTDVCIKHKVRDYIRRMKGTEEGYDIYIQSDMCLNDKDAAAREAIMKDKGKGETYTDSEGAAYMCKHNYDIRTFGAVMTQAGSKNGSLQVKGPVQLGFGRTIEPISWQRVTITRSAVATQKEKSTHDNTMGDKYIIPYGLYKIEGHISAEQAARTGFSDEDKELLFDALLNMWDEDTSAARGHVACRKLYLFEHNSVHGSCPSYKLFDAVSIKRKDTSKPARQFSDYEIMVGEIPAGVTMTERA